MNKTKTFTDVVEYFKLNAERRKPYWSETMEGVYYVLTHKGEELECFVGNSDKFGSCVYFFTSNRVLNSEWLLSEGLFV